MKFWDTSALLPLLAAALIVSENDPESIEFVCLGQRLNQAAAREGFRIMVV